MKPYPFLMALPFLFAGQANAGPLLSAITGAGGSTLTLEDNSRELLIDVDGDGHLSPGDVLLGYVKVDLFTPPATNANNAIYGIFSQTFDATTFANVSLSGGTRYSGTFIATPDTSLYSLENLLPTLSGGVGGFTDGAMIAFVDATSGFSAALDTANLPTLGNVNGAITSILDTEGSLAFTVGLSDTADFFAFETVILGGPGQPADFVVNPAVTSTIPVSQPLGNFGAGLSVLDNYLPVTFFRDQTTTFFQNNTSTNFGQSQSYDLAVVNGNFGGIQQSPGNVIQGGGLSFVNNADATLRAERIPEPGSLALLGLGLTSLFGFQRLRKSATA